MTPASAAAGGGVGSFVTLPSRPHGALSARGYRPSPAIREMNLRHYTHCLNLLRRASRDARNRPWAFAYQWRQCRDAGKAWARGVGTVFPAARDDAAHLLKEYERVTKPVRTGRPDLATGLRFKRDLTQHIASVRALDARAASVQQRPTDTPSATATAR